MSSQKAEARSEQRAARMARVRTYRDLIVWQRAMELVTEVYAASQGLSRAELYGLSGQMRRAAVLVPSNIAEGYARNSDGDFARFLRMACGSLYELQTQVEITQRLGYLTANVVEGMTGLSAEVEKMLSRLIGKVSEHHGSQDAQE